MSTGSSSTRDPILDEDEDDWVQMKIEAGSCRILTVEECSSACHC